MFKKPEARCGKGGQYKRVLVGETQGREVRENQTAALVGTITVEVGGFMLKPRVFPSQTLRHKGAPGNSS
jgi:hypothetical protein